MNRNHPLFQSLSAVRTSTMSAKPGRAGGIRRYGRIALAASLSVAAVLAGVSARADEAAIEAPTTKVDLTKDHVLYEIGYSHLDTEWCWNYPQVIREFIPNTLHENFALFEQYPDYTFNWTGANRYRFMQEYYPEDWAKLKKYVAAGRWFPNGSSLEEGDVNNPSSESLVRQVLYGNEFFRQEFGKAGTDYMLPDCFGFPASLPTILAHSGVKGFSTQKLTWGSAVGIPFNVGTWIGTDDQGVLAALNGGSYTNQVHDDVSQNKAMFDRVDSEGKKYGVYVDYVYFGKGDRGGSAGEGSAPWIEKSVKGTGPLKVISGNADEMFNIITPSEQKTLPTYKGDLELTGHSAGSLTSEVAMKRWNRMNETLGDAAEKASVGAMILGSQPYPMARITDAWWRFLPGQFHDLMAGTALPESYTYTWNDEIIAMNEFSGVLRQSVGGVSRALDTRAPSGATSVVVYNPLSTFRQDVVEASVALPGGSADGVIVRGPDGKPVAAQVLGHDGAKTRFIFLASVPSVGTAVYNVMAGPAVPSGNGLSVAMDTVENARYRVKLNADGDISSIFDKTANKEMLTSPMRLAFQYENPVQWPAWNMDWADQQKPPRAYVDGPAKIEIVENGPVRVAVRVTRSAQGSKFSQTVRLAAGAAGNHVEFADNIDWKSKESALKAVFPLSVSNPMATYNWGMGTIVRDNNNEKRFEVGSHQWFDLTDTSGSYGVTVLSNDRNASDKPDNNTLRLTLLYTPGIRGGYQHQATQDWGRHNLVYGLEGHTGDWRQGDSQWEAARLNQPLVAFTTPSHDGPMGKQYSLAAVNDPHVQIEAMKRAEASDEVIVRFNELSGLPVKDARLTLAAPIVSAREVNGQEESIPGDVKVQKGALVFDMEGYRPRAFALKLGKAPKTFSAPTSTPVSLPFDTAVANAPGKTDSAFDAQGRSIPAEMLPEKIESDGVTFELGRHGAGEKNAVSCAGQTISLPSKGATRLYLLAASYGGDTSATFTVDGNPVELKIQDWSGFVGQWDNREWGGVVPELTYDWHNPLVGLTPGFVKPASVAWYSDHWRLADGKNDPYRFCYLFRYAIDLPAGAKSLTLPSNPKVRILAASVGNNPNEDVVPAQPLYDTLADHKLDGEPQIMPNGGTFTDATSVTAQTPLYFSANGGLHYTTDGSDPNASSPVLSSGVMLSQTTTLKVRQIGADGTMSPVSSAKFDINDTTPPSLVKTETTGLSSVKLTFSEPLDQASAEDTSHYTLRPAATVTGAKLAADGKTVNLTLGSAALQQTGATVTVTGVKDVSPAGNAVNGVAGTAAVFGPAYTTGMTQTFTGKDRGRTVQNLPNLPTDGSAPWTINMFVYTDQNPDELTILGGFGNATDTSGTQRFLIKFKDGISFWGSNIDVATGVSLDLGKWQMLTATYDGKTLRIYKNGAEIKNEDATLSDALPEVKIATRGPWDNSSGRFAGKIANFSVWNQALSPDYLKGLMATAPK